MQQFAYKNIWLLGDSGKHVHVQCVPITNMCMYVHVCLKLIIWQEPTYPIIPTKAQQFFTTLMIIINSLSPTPPWSVLAAVQLL